MADQRDSVERNKLLNVFGDGNRAYGIPAKTMPVVMGQEGQSRTMPVNLEAQLQPKRTRGPQR